MSLERASGKPWIGLAGVEDRLSLSFQSLGTVTGKMSVVCRSFSDLRYKV